NGETYTDRIGENVVTDSQAPATTSFKLRILGRELYVTAASEEKVYDGKELTNDNYTISNYADSTVEGSIIYHSDDERITVVSDSASKDYAKGATGYSDYYNTLFGSGNTFKGVDIDGSITLVGEEDNVPSGISITDSTETDVTGDFTTTYNNGTLKVTKRTLTITAKSDSKVYDGTALTNSEVLADGLANGDSIKSVTVTGSQTALGNSENKASNANIMNKSGQNVTSCYDIKYVSGTLTVARDSLTIKTESAEKTYDGTALTKYSFTITNSSGTIELSVSSSNSQVVLGDDDSDLTTNVITSPNGENFSALMDILIGEGNTLILSVTGSQTVAGSSDNLLLQENIDVKNSESKSLKSQFAFVLEYGTLTVNELDLTVTALDETKTYDGTANVSSSYLLSRGVISGTSPALKYTASTNSWSVYDGENEDTDADKVKALRKTLIGDGNTVAGISFEGSQIEVGKSENTPSDLVIHNAAHEDVSDSFNVTYVNGLLEITKRTLTITAKSDSKVYDGTALTYDSHSLKSGSSLADGDEIKSIKVSGSRTEYGTSDNTASDAVITNSRGKDVTSSYNISYETGKLSITKRPIVITAESAEKTYDGKALTEEGYEVSGVSGNTDSGLVDTDKVTSVTVEGSQTVVNETATEDTRKLNTPSNAVIKNSNNEIVTDCYSITYNKGTLTVKSRPIEITAGSAGKTYDGTALTCSTYEVTDGSLAKDQEISSVEFTESSTITNIGSIDNEIKNGKVKIVSGTTDVTGNYDITLKKGTLTISGKKIVITALDNSKTYDGTALTGKEYTIANADGSIVLKLDGDSNAQSTNKKVLSGGEDSEFDTLLAELIGDGAHVGVTFKGSVTDVESTSTSVQIDSVSIVDSSSSNITGNFDISKVAGKLNVTPKELEVTAVDTSKKFDGTALTGDLYNISDVDGKIVLQLKASDSSYFKIIKNGDTTIVDPDNATLYANLLVKLLGHDNSVQSIKLTGSQTEAGSSEVKPSAMSIGYGTNDETSNFNITYNEGTLTVISKTLKITAVDATKTYDGTPLTEKVYTIENLDGTIKLQAGTTDSDK
nr:hypothetical protein [Lachnospiraceae bacterium]